MKALNYASFIADVVKARLFRERKPLVVGLNVTNRCNLKCKYCYGDYANRSSKDFTKAELFGLIDILSKMGTRLIHLGGGEPLLRDDLGELIDRIKTKNMLCFMNTNGLLVPERIKEIKKLDGLTISLDGDEAANDSTRGEGTFRKALRAIEIVSSLGIPLSTNTVLNKNNLNSLETIITLAKKWGFYAEFNLPYEQVAGGGNNGLVDLSDAEIKTALLQLIDYTRRGAPFSFSLATRKYALSWPLSYSRKIIYDRLPSGFKMLNCYMGRFMCLIDAEGLVYPCGQLLGRFPALNVKEVGFEKAWQNTLEKRTCKTCYCMCFTEFNQLFGLKPAMLVWAARRFLRSLGRKQSLEIK